MPYPSLDMLARQLSDLARCGPHRLCSQIVQHVTRGKPVAQADLAASLQMSQHDLSHQLARLPDVELDQEGHILGWGLTLVPTPYRLRLCGHWLFTWCAFDTLQIPPALQTEAHVRSICAATGQPISFSVTAEGTIRDLTPAEARLSLIVPASCTGDGDDDSATSVRTAFCQQSLFFQSEQAASTFLLAHPAAVLLSVEEAATLGKLVTAHCLQAQPRNEAQ